MPPVIARSEVGTTKQARLTKKLFAIYNRLYKEFGPRHWWPADTPFEVMVGAVLTQNTAWSNVEKAIKNLKDKRLLKFSSLASLKRQELARLVRPAGYYNVKAKRLKNLLNFLKKEFDSSLKKFFSLSTEGLRSSLLGVNGIGPETADSIILYAAKRPIFVVDAYTKRILLRHKIVKSKASYHDIQSIFMSNLPMRTPLFKEYHALIVQLGKVYCRKKPLCRLCPLKNI